MKIQQNILDKQTNLDKLAEVVAAQPHALVSDAGTKSRVEPLNNIRSRRKRKAIQEKGNDVLSNKKAK